MKSRLTNKIIGLFYGLMSLAALHTSAASAAIVSGSITGGTVQGTGNVIILDPASSSFAVGNNDFDTNNLYVFKEKQNFKLFSDLTPDVGSIISAGNYINSHLVVFDPLQIKTVKATLLFDTPVLGLARKGTTLIATNYLGAPSVTYNTPGYFGLEPGIDFVTPGVPDANSVKINLLSGDIPGDVFRIFTLGQAPTGVPEPMTWALMLIGFAFCGAALRRSRAIAMTQQDMVA